MASCLFFLYSASYAHLSFSDGKTLYTIVIIAVGLSFFLRFSFPVNDICNDRQNITFISNSASSREEMLLSVNVSCISSSHFSCLLYYLIHKHRPYIEGKRTVPETQCYIQFLETNLYITFGTALAAFYIPVTVSCCFVLKDKF